MGGLSLKKWNENNTNELIDPQTQHQRVDRSPKHNTNELILMDLLKKNSTKWHLTKIQGHNPTSSVVHWKRVRSGRSEGFSPFFPGRFGGREGQVSHKKKIGHFPSNSGCLKGGSLCHGMMVWNKGPHNWERNLISSIYTLSKAQNRPFFSLIFLWIVEVCHPQKKVALRPATLMVEELKSPKKRHCFEA